jgi:hypothetical protein
MLLSKAGEGVAVDLVRGGSGDDAVGDRAQGGGPAAILQQGTFADDRPWAELGELAAVNPDAEHTVEKQVDVAARLTLPGEQPALGYSAGRGLAATAHDGGRQLPFEGAWSLMRSSTACINLSCGIAEKQFAMSVSTTHRLPRQASSMSTCRASCADRLGRNPKLHGRKSATIFTAACTIRSRTAAIASGRFSLLPGLGISTLRAGSGRHRPLRSSSASSPSSRVTPYSSTMAKVVLSMPGAPLLRRTAIHARHRTSSR